MAYSSSAGRGCATGFGWGSGGSGVPEKTTKVIGWLL